MSDREEKNGFISSVVKGAALAVIISLIGALVFALVLSLTDLNGAVIKTVNQFVKILSVFLGCFFFVKEKAGLIKGLLIGAVSTTLTFLIFSLVMGEISFGTSFFADLFFMSVVGAVCGIIAVNVKKD